jgi:flagellar protein FliJ
MERANMEQAMRNHYGLGVAEATRPEALRNVTPAARPKTYARHRNSEQALIRLKDLQIDMARRQVAQIEAMITDFDCMLATLDNEIVAEESRTGIRDPAHFAYSILAKTTIARRNNLKRTLTGLKDELAVTMIKLAEVSHDWQDARTRQPSRRSAAARPGWKR